MKTSFLRNFEIREIRNNYESILKSPEATRVSILYQTETGASGSGVDNVYQVNDNPSELVREDRIACIQHFPKHEEMSSIPIGLQQAGVCIFYFSSYLDLTQPRVTKKAIEDTLYIIDPLGKEWEPINKEERMLINNAVYMLGNMPVGNPVFCRPRKTVK